MGANENVQIIENVGLVIISHNDILNQKSIETTILDLIKNPFFKHEYDVLIYLRSSVIQITLKEIEDICSFVYDNIKEIGINKFAILSSSFQSNKLAKYICNNSQSSAIQSFSYIDAALNWLDIPVERKLQVKIKLRNLDENYLNRINYNLKEKYLYRLNYG